MNLIIGKSGHWANGSVCQVHLTNVQQNISQLSTWEPGGEPRECTFSGDFEFELRQWVSSPGPFDERTAEHFTTLNVGTGRGTA
jgi:hypothetical protein